MKNALHRRILKLCKDFTPTGGSEATGLLVYDIKNLRAGNGPSLRTVLKLVTKGRYSPKFLLFGKRPQKLQEAESTRLVQHRLIAARIRRLARERPAKEVAADTGLPVFTIYEYRGARKRPGLHVILGFLAAGFTTDHLFFGK